MRFIEIPKTCTPDDDTLPHMLHQLTAGLIGGIVIEGNAVEVHQAILSLVHHLAGVGGFMFPAEDDENFVAAVTERLRANLIEARDAKGKGFNYVPEHMLPVRIRHERVGANRGTVNEQPADPRIAAESERVAGDFLSRLRGAGPTG